MALTCKQCLHSLGDYLDDALNRAMRSGFNAHLRKCPECRILCRTTRATVQLYKSMRFYSVPPDVESRLMAAIETRMVARRR